MVEIKVSSVTIGGRPYNKDKSGYPILPTVMSGVEITWGAPSCMEHPEPSRAQLSMWVPKTHESYLPTLGEVVEVKGGVVLGGYTPSNSLFAGKVESVKFEDDYKPAATPLSVRTNGSTNPVPSSTSGYGSSGGVGTWTHETSEAAPFNRFTKNSASAIATAFYVQPDQSIPAASTVSGRAWVRTSYATTVSVRNGGTVIAGSAKAIPANTWTEITFDGYDVPVSTFRLAFLISAFQPNASFDVKQSLWEIAPTAGAYFSGDTADTSTNVNEWSGTANASASTQSVYASERATGGYRVNIVAADALAEAARLRLSDAPWLFESAQSRMERIASLATNNGVVFDTVQPTGGGFPELLNTNVQYRDVDSMPALEAFQRTAMAAGSVVISSRNVVRPSESLALPTNLNSSQSQTTTNYWWAGTPFNSISYKKTNNVTVRTNHATNAVPVLSTTQYAVIPGTGASADINIYYGAYNGSATLGGVWTVASTGGQRGVKYNQTTSGAASSKVSAGAWVKTNLPAGKSFKLLVVLRNGTTVLGTYASAAQTIALDTWTYMKMENVTAPSAYTAIDVIVEAQSNMTVNEAILVNGVIIEKASTSPDFFYGYTFDPATNAIAAQTTTMPVIDAGHILDGALELDTSRVVNEIKVEMKRMVGSLFVPSTAQGDATVDFDQIFTDEAGSRKTTPQSRSIATDWAIADPFDDVSAPSSTSAMVLKGKLLLAGQSKARWRLAEPMNLVLSEMPEDIKLNYLIIEETRFGQSMQVTNATTKLPQYVRTHAGRLVLGDTTSLELQVESVEYSAPLPLSAGSLANDTIASNYRIQNFKTLSSNDLRSIGAR